MTSSKKRFPKPCSLRNPWSVMISNHSANVFSHPDCTVGPGIAPGRPLEEVHGLYHRSGVSPCPKDCLFASMRSIAQEGQGCQFFFCRQEDLQAVSRHDHHHLGVELLRLRLRFLRDQRDPRGHVRLSQLHAGLHPGVRVLPLQDLPPAHRAKIGSSRKTVARGGASLFDPCR